VNTALSIQVPHKKVNLFYQLTHYQFLTAPVQQGNLFMNAMNICFANFRFTVLADNWIRFELLYVRLQVSVPIKVQNLSLS
jgi:hypothetical protein